MRWQRIASGDAPPVRVDSDPVHAHRAALERGDEVVQQLSIAKYALGIGDTDRAMSAIDSALIASRRSLGELLGIVRAPGMLSFAGSLVRTFPAGSHCPERDET